MLIDVAVLRIMKHKSEYQKLFRAVPDKAVDSKTKAILDDFGKYFEQFKTHEAVDVDMFMSMFRRWHPTMNDETYNTYLGVLRNIKQDVDEDTRQGILAQLYELDLATKIANTVARFDAGELELPISDLIGAAIDSYKVNIGIRAIPWNDTPIEDLLEIDMDMSGIKWRLNCLNESMRPLRPGDFGVIAGRPDKGKTSFLASEVTYMARQLPEDLNVIWLNNEGPSDRIIKTLYRSAMGKTITELVELKKQGKLRRMYELAVGRLDRIRVIDVHGMHVGQVEAILENLSPGIVVYDMIDNIRGFSTEARNDLQLEEMYQWARERCVKYNCIGLASSQISAEGEGEQYPGLSMLKDSKTGKQGACDFQLMIGASNDQTLLHSRFISLPKNKLQRDGFPKDPHCEVHFKSSIARYEDIQSGN